MKKAGLSIAACGVAAVMVGTLTASGSMSKSAGGVKSPDPVTVEQTDAAGVSLTSEPQTARAGEVGVQEVTAQLEPSNAICDLEWTLSVGDSEIPEADMSEYLTIEETSAISIELVCHQRYDGFAELHVEDLLTGKTASASVTAWNYDGGNNYLKNSDFSTNTSGETRFFFSTRGQEYTGAGPIQKNTVDNWLMFSETDYASNCSMILQSAVDAMVISLYTTTADMSYTFGFVQAVPTEQIGGSTTQLLYPGRSYYMVVEMNVISNSPTPELYYTNSGSYGESGSSDGWFSATQDGVWRYDGERDGIVVIKFHVNGWDYSNANIGIGFTRDPSSPMATAAVKSISLYPD